MAGGLLMALWLAPAVMLFVAVLPLPYAYYQLLRLVVCVCAAVVAFLEYKAAKGEATAFVVIFVVIAVVMNPFLPVHLTKAIWTPINIIFGLTFLWHLWSRRAR